MRPSSLILATSFVCFSVAAATGADDAKVDFKVTAEELAKEFKADAKAAGAKYKGKSVEITGTVWATRHDVDNILLNGFKSKPTDVVGELAYLNVTGESKSKIRGLAKGQTVTARGVMDGGPFAGLNKCDVIKVGPSTAIPATIEKLDTEYKMNRVAFKKKYTGLQFLLKAKVANVIDKDSFMIWTVTYTAKKNGVKIEVVTGGFLSRELNAEFRAVKEGDEITFLVSLDSIADDMPFSLRDVVLLKELPEGVKLPAVKK